MARIQEPTTTLPHDAQRASVAEWSGRRIHFIGVGGCGMSGLANVFHQLGARVSGSDEKESIFTRSLQKAGVVVNIGHDPRNVPTDALVVYSSAVRPDNPERMTAKQMGLEEIHRSGLLAELTRRAQTIAVCGAHGKTTTSALLAHVLIECGRSPSYVIGGLPKSPMAHSQAGEAELLVIEADESDRSLVRYCVDTLVVTNIDLDHIRDGGYQTRAEVAEVIAELGKKSRVVIAPPDAGSYFSQLENLEIVSPQMHGSLNSFALRGVPYTTHAPGAHQIENAALVADVALRLGCDSAQIALALTTFPGLARRYDVVGRLSSGAQIIDDYAHHPAELEAVINAARRGTNGRIIVAFQPHLFSRTLHFAREFAEALSLADLAYVEEIYASRERREDWPDVSRSLILDQPSLQGVRKVNEAPSRQELASLFESIATPEDTVLVLGAGDISEFAKLLVHNRLQD